MTRTAKTYRSRNAKPWEFPGWSTILIAALGLFGYFLPNRALAAAGVVLGMAWMVQNIRAARWVADQILEEANRGDR
jgi:uncharacterized membrane protein HdeD (DUF308 family)